MPLVGPKNSARSPIRQLPGLDKTLKMENRPFAPPRASEGGGFVMYFANARQAFADRVTPLVTGLGAACVGRRSMLVRTAFWPKPDGD